MGNLFNDDYWDFIHALKRAHVEYMLIGGYAVILRGYKRATGDMDIFVHQTRDNYNRIVEAFHYIRKPLSGINADALVSDTDFEVFSLGVAPRQIVPAPAQHLIYFR